MWSRTLARVSAGHRSGAIGALAELLAHDAGVGGDLGMALADGAQVGVDIAAEPIRRRRDPPPVRLLLLVQVRRHVAGDVSHGGRGRARQRPPAGPPLIGVLRPRGQGSS